jgi:hypothetical protein
MRKVDTTITRYRRRKTRDNEIVVNLLIAKGAISPY